MFFIFEQNGIGSKGNNTNVHFMNPGKSLIVREKNSVTTDCYNSLATTSVT